jgi:hypothetical protein
MAHAVKLALFLATASANAARDAAKAASLQAQVTIAAASPRLVIIGQKLVQYRRGISFEDPAREVRGQLRPLIQIHNAGGARMLVSRMCIRLVIAETLPADPEYDAIKAVNYSFEVGQSLWMMDREKLFTLSETEVGDVETNATTLWVYGLFSYLNHTTNENVTHGFVMQWAPWDDLLIAEGPPNYSYQKKERANPTD